MSRKFLIKLNAVHDQSEKSVYRVTKDTGLVYNTVKRYVTNVVEAELLSRDVIKLAEYYGVDWRDPAVIEIIDDETADTRPVETVDEDDEEDEDHLYTRPSAAFVS